MIEFVKYSNERDPAFRICTMILSENGHRFARKIPCGQEALAHIKGIFHHSLSLAEDLKDTVFHVNACQMAGEGLDFEFAEGKTLEETLDELLAQKKYDQIESRMKAFFDAFNNSEQMLPFVSTPEFENVFGSFKFPEGLMSRELTDIDMIFSNAICRPDEEGYELIDYEWTFDFPIPVEFVIYRCIRYYCLGNASRSELAKKDYYGQFGISGELQKIFEKMEDHFQTWEKGTSIPNDSLYDVISKGCISAKEEVKKAGKRKEEQQLEVFFDTGKGYHAGERMVFAGKEGKNELVIPIPAGTKEIRFDPMNGCACLVRLFEIRQDQHPLDYSMNGRMMHNGDLLFDQEDGQIYILPSGEEPVHICFQAEKLDGLSRELILNQEGQIDWMEQTKAWRVYRKFKPGVKK